MILKPMTTAAASAPDQDSTRFRVLGAISFSHFLNDMLQSLLLAIYPLLKGNYQLSFAEIGLMTLTYQCTASLLQPLVGLYTDKKPMPYSLVLGMGATLCGLLLLSSAGSFPLLLLAAALVGTGSSVFHPESSRVARMAGGRPGLAQSIFQVGGNAGSASGPLLAALIVIPWARAASPGSVSPPCWRWRSCSKSASGTAINSARPKPPPPLRRRRCLRHA